MLSYISILRVLFVFVGFMVCLVNAEIILKDLKNTVSAYIYMYVCVVCIFHLISILIYVF